MLASLRISAIGLRACLVGVVLAAVASPAAATEYTGQVLLNGVPVPGASVTATRDGQKVTVSTDPRGLYRFPDLADGVWTVRAEMLGFTPVTREVTVAAGATPQQWELRLQPFADITRTVPVSPGVVPTPDRRGAPASPPAPGSPTTSRPAAPAGTAAPAGATSAPGAVASTGRAGGPSAEAASGNSFLVSGTVNAAASSPSSQNGSSLDATTRRLLGLPQYNASLSTQFGGSRFDSTSPSFTGRPTSQPDYHDLNLTGTFSGPLRIPGVMRTSKNVSVNYSRSSNSDATTMSQQMPTFRQRTGDFSQTIDGFGRPVQIVDPATGLPFPGNVIPRERISPQAASLLQYYPVADPAATGIYNYQVANLSERQQDRISGTLSQLLSSNNYSVGVNGGYSQNRNESTSLFGFDNRSHGSGVDAGMNWQFRTSNTSYNRVRYSYNRAQSYTDPFFAYKTNVSGEAGITGNNQAPENWGPPGLSFSSGIAGLSDAQFSFNRSQNHTWNIELQRTRGRHNFTFGGDARLLLTDLIAQQNARGAFTFNGAVTGYDFADFLLGVPATSAIASGNADKRYRSWNHDAYVTDDFRVSATFSIQVGVRWDYEMPVTEAGNRLVNLDVAPDFSAVAPVIATDGVGTVTGRRYSRALIDDDPFGIQPRVGVAWRPSTLRSFIVRGGYGVYRNTSVYQSLATVLAQQPPLSDTFNAVNSADTPLTLANGFVTPPSGTLNTFAIDPEFHVGLVHRWQASLQFDLPAGLTLSNTYAAGRGVNLLQAFLPNTVAPGATNPCPACPSGFVYLTSHGDSIQHGWQIQLRRRLRSGLSWTTSYTLSKATDNAAGFTTSGISSSIGGAGVNGVSVAQDWLNLDAERGPSSFDQRHVFSVQAQYSTGQGVSGGALLSGWRGALVKGWTIASQLSAGSGLPLTPIYRATPVAGVTGTVRASLTGAALHDIPSGYYANPAAFAPPAAGTWGTASRNSIRGPETFTLDASFSRSFALNDRMGLEWQTNVTNLLNRVTYSTIDATVGSAQFGAPIGTTPARRIRSNLRWRF